MSQKSQFASLLNELVCMQESSYYAARKGVLGQAEGAIVGLEEKVAKLQSEVEVLKARLDKYEKGPE